MAEYEITGTKQITELPEATSYTDGMYYAVASANGGTEKVSVTKNTPPIEFLNNYFDTEVTLTPNDILTLECEENYYYNYSA